MFSDPISAYKQVSIESEVRGADPHRLIVLLFEGVEAALNKASEQIERKDIIGKSESLNKAISIIMEGLSASLNVEQGGELAERLQALYAYIVSRIIHANIHMDMVALREAQTLIGDIANAWREIRPQATGNASPENNAR